jgi:hypothetical protein
MMIPYYRKQRESINHPATVDDLAFETLSEVFVYLGEEDLSSMEKVNRSWRVTAQDPIRSQYHFGYRDQRRRPPVWLCGVQLSRIVLGDESISIKNLDLDLRFRYCEFNDPFSNNQNIEPGRPL